MKIAIQGTAGSFHEQAAELLTANQGYDIIPCSTFAKVFNAVTNNIADYGISAIENNLHGSINGVYRLLERHELWITAELRMRIEQCLIGYEDLTLDDLAAAGDKVTVMSQAPALAQVEQWLDAHLPDAIRQETHDTADSVRQVMKRRDPLTLAIASKKAATLYGGRILMTAINDDPGNYTRFVLLQKEHAVNPNADASSYILTTDHSPGALVRALNVFSEANVNLTKLDSHPIAGDQQHYAFYIDADIPVESSVMQDVLPALAAQGCDVRVLGSYQRLL